LLEYDIKGLFDNLDHQLLMKAVKKHTDNKYVLLYIERWLTTPMQMPDGTLQEKTRGVMQGGLCKALHNEPYAKKKIMQSNWTYASKNMNLDLIYSA
jgi:retron-type reverse transcriptase